MCSPQAALLKRGGTSAAGRESPESFLYRSYERENSPELRLARAKILLMFQDLAGKGPGNRSNKEKLRQDSERWFFNPIERDDFNAWCETAGLLPARVCQKAKDILLNGWPQWRAKAGKSHSYAKRKAARDLQKESKEGRD